MAHIKHERSVKFSEGDLTDHKEKSERECEGTAAAQ